MPSYASSTAIPNPRPRLSATAPRDRSGESALDAQTPCEDADRASAQHVPRLRDQRAPGHRGVGEAVHDVDRNEHGNAVAEHPGPPDVAHRQDRRGKEGDREQRPWQRVGRRYVADAACDRERGVAPAQFHRPSRHDEMALAPGPEDLIGRRALEARAPVAPHEHGAVPRPPPVGWARRLRRVRRRPGRSTGALALQVRAVGVRVLEHTSGTDAQPRLARIADHDDVGGTAVHELDASAEIEETNVELPGGVRDADDLALVVGCLDAGDGMCVRRWRGRDDSTGDERDCRETSRETRPVHRRRCERDARAPRCNCFRDDRRVRSRCRTYGVHASTMARRPTTTMTTTVPYPRPDVPTGEGSG